MQRDTDFLRALLFKYEADDDWLLMMPGSNAPSSDEEWREAYHVKLMIDEGLLEEVGRGTMRLTSKGHDFLDAIRSDTVWNRTKGVAAEIGGSTLGILQDIALAYLKAKAAKLLGVEV
jgi:hypothetical protein